MLSLSKICLSIHGEVIHTKTPSYQAKAGQGISLTRPAHFESHGDPPARSLPDAPLEGAIIIPPRAVRRREIGHCVDVRGVQEVVVRGVYVGVEGAGTLAHDPPRSVVHVPRVTLTHSIVSHAVLHCDINNISNIES
jgi:hypothetical protein